MNLFEYIDIQKKPYDIFYTDSVSSPMHWHYYSEILYVKSGQIKLICETDEYTLRPGDLCYIYPLQLHEVAKSTGEKADYAVIKFDIHTINIPDAYVPKMYEYFVYRTRENDDCLIVNNAFDIFEEIGNIVNEFKSGELFHMFKLQTGIYSILIYLARNCDKIFLHRSDIQKDNSISFYNILEYIDLHSNDKLEMTKLAEKCNLSYSHFARKFRETYGRSCKEYIAYIRLTKADELLMHTDYDISYIAMQTGFFDSSHFIKAYKSWKGVTPKQQRFKYLLGTD